MSDLLGTAEGTTMNDVETIQRARGWRECSEHNGFWLSPQDNHTCVHPLPNPLTDTPDGWWEFEQILKWAHDKGWELALELLPRGPYHADVYTKDRLWLGLGRGDFRAAIVAALAAAVRRESEEPNG